MNDNDSGVKGIRAGRPPMLGSRRLSPRTPVPTPGPFQEGRTAQGSRTAQGGNAAPGGKGRQENRGAEQPILVRPAAPKQRVLFVCIGNSCRSQMAEGFARTYGGDILVAQSAGLSPAAIIQPLTMVVMAERNVRIENQFPKGMEILAREQFDIVVNMSGQKLPVAPGVIVRDWAVRDPMGQKDATYKAVAEQIEGLVMRLILELRSATL